ncbi:MULTISPECIES: hybrid sensor histidine kinase/response regulator [Nostocales]|uniref:Circadian input-output histidine kinase CikA n=3 Tax=Nostocales TaxID=1161 RepID=A0A8S9SZR4_9CYAN|nr:PAS domain S-box protein [Tolypothrix bouteillei]KAF3885318.1 PAS domain S-box protein [Tolypothrix bouteillei VB521301]
MKGNNLLAPYFITALAVGSALTMTLLLQSMLTPTLFQLFFAAVAISSRYGGMESGLLATVLSSLAIGYFFSQPIYSLDILAVDNLFRLGIFIIVSILISSLNLELRNAKQHLEISVQKLRSSETRFRRLIESNIFGVAFGDSSGGIHYANDYFLNMVGYTAEDLQFKKVRWDVMTPPEYRQRDAKQVEESKKNGIATPYEKEYLRKDGSRVPILIGGVIVEEPGANELEMIAFALDLSDRKRVEEALRQRDSEMRLITNAVPALISYVDAQQRYRFNNKGYEEWHGISASDIYGKTIKEVVGESVYESICPHVEAVLSGEHVTYESNLKYIDGVSRYVNISYVPQFNSDEVVGFVALIQDITERKQAEIALKESEERFRQLAEKAEATNRIKDEFLATLSHELRTPLNAMLGWTQLLTTRKFDENTTARALETLDRNTKLLSTLIEDVLDVSRIITGKLRLDVRQVKLVPVVLSAIETIRSAADAKDITIESFLDPSIGIVLGDSNRLQQVVWNLLSNAVKFTPRGGKVEVKLFLEESQWEKTQRSALIEVKDTGEGIAPEFLPYVFERFRQADSSSTRAHGGLGLGLAIVRHLIELHGGIVCVTSPGIGQGATFIVSLPLKTGGKEESERVTEKEKLRSSLPPVYPSPHPLNGLRILVVDDEPDARQIITTALGQYKATVMAVATATEAFEALQRFQPDVLVSDISMPQEDGYSLIRKIRELSEEQGGRTPAVALTAYARAEDCDRALLAGFQLHVPKPVNPDELAAVIANLVGEM